MRLVKTALLCLALALSTGADSADWKKLLDKVPGTGGATAGAATGAAALSQGEIAEGLKQALGQGVEKAIGTLGRPDGFLGNPQVRIPLPGALQKVESGLRMLGQDRYADEFIETMNHAAEEAVPEAASIFGNAISEMSIEDARGILDGPDDAATQYFKRTATDDLVERFRPIVEQATDKAGVTSAYKSFLDKAGPAAQLARGDATDIDGYVTDKAVDGLFKMIAAEEKRIRAQPLARTTDLLKKVFAR